MRFLIKFFIAAVLFALFDSLAELQLGINYRDLLSINTLFFFVCFGIALGIASLFLRLFDAMMQSQRASETK